MDISLTIAVIQYSMSRSDHDALFILVSYYQDNLNTLINDTLLGHNMQSTQNASVVVGDINRTF